MERPKLERLSKETLVALYRALVGSPGDYARNPKEFYRNALDARGSAELVAALERVEVKPRKQDKRTVERRNAAANAKEFRGIARALLSWGAELASNPEVIATLQARARVALGE